MVQESRHHLFFRCIFAARTRQLLTKQFVIDDMKKFFYLIASIALLMGAISCSNDDEPKPNRGDGVFTVNTPMINHIVNINSGEIVGMSSTQNKLVLDTVNHQASVELTYNDGNGNKTVKLSGITATAKRMGFYNLTANANGELKDFSGYVDFNESSIRYSYTTADGYRVISTIAEVFFLKTKNTITYDDTTKTTVMDNSMYQFTLDPPSNTATVSVMAIVHAKDLKYFINLTALNVPVSVTRNGYTIAGDNLKTNGTYISSTDSLGSRTSTTDKYPFKTFNAVVDLENDSIIANFMMGNSATVYATGRTYPNYTSY